MKDSWRDELKFFCFGLAMFVLLIAVTGLVQAQNSQGIAVIPAPSFRHNGDNANTSGLVWSYSGSILTNVIINSSSTLTPCLMAPVTIPEGAELTEFRASFQNALTYTTFSVDLRRVELATGQVDNLAEITEGTVPSSEYTSPILVDKAIISSDYGYYATFCLPPNKTTNALANVFYGARIFYEKP